MIRITTGEGQLAFDPQTATWSGDRALVELTELYPARAQAVTPAGPFLPEDWADEQWQLLHAVDMLESAGITYRIEEWPPMPDTEGGCIVI